MGTHAPSRARLRFAGGGPSSSFPGPVRPGPVDLGPVRPGPVDPDQRCPARRAGAVSAPSRNSRRPHGTRPHRPAGFLACGGRGDNLWGRWGRPVERRKVCAGSLPGTAQWWGTAPRFYPRGASAERWEGVHKAGSRPGNTNDVRPKCCGRLTRRTLGVVSRALRPPINSTRGIRVANADRHHGCPQAGRKRRNR